MKSMVKILVTIMALSLAEAPVFAAWPTEGMKVTQKVAHLKVSYPGAIDQINALGGNPRHNALNALEAELSAAAVVPAPVGEVMAMVVGGGAGLDLELGGGVLALADEDGGAVGVLAVGAKRQRIAYTGVDCPVLASKLQVAPTQREMLIANGSFVNAKEAERAATGKLNGLEKHFQPGGDKAGMDISKL